MRIANFSEWDGIIYIVSILVFSSSKQFETGVCELCGMDVENYFVYTTEKNCFASYLKINTRKKRTRQLSYQWKIESFFRSSLSERRSERARHSDQMARASRIYDVCLKINYKLQAQRISFLETFIIYVLSSKSYRRTKLPCEIFDIHITERARRATAKEINFDVNNK